MKDMEKVQIEYICTQEGKDLYRVEGCSGVYDAEEIHRLYGWLPEREAHLASQLR